MKVTNTDTFFYDKLGLWCTTGDVHLPVSGRVQFTGWGATPSAARRDFWNDAGETWAYENDLRCASL